MPHYHTTCRRTRLHDMARRRRGGAVELSSRQGLRARVPQLPRDASRPQSCQANMHLKYYVLCSREKPQVWALLERFQLKTAACLVALVGCQHMDPCPRAFWGGALCHDAVNELHSTLHALPTLYQSRVPHPYRSTRLFVDVPPIWGPQFLPSSTSSLKVYARFSNTALFLRLGPNLGVLQTNLSPLLSPSLPLSTVASLLGQGCFWSHLE